MQAPPFGTDALLVWRPTVPGCYDTLDRRLRRRITS
jgi:hypothetical protein